MAESYFELLTGQSGYPAKPFDPVGELKRLRQNLTLRMQVSEPEPPKAESQTITPTPDKVSQAAEVSEPVVLETVVKTVRSMKKTLTVRQRSRFRRRFSRAVVLQENFHPENRRQISEVVAQYLVPPQEGKLETINAGLTALGIVSIVFGFLSFYRGWENDLSLGSLVCISGLAVIGIGLGGRFLASHAELS